MMVLFNFKLILMKKIYIHNYIIFQNFSHFWRNRATQNAKKKYSEGKFPKRHLFQKKNPCTSFGFLSNKTECKTNFHWLNSK